MRYYGVHPARLFEGAFDLENPDFAVISEHPANTGEDPAMVVGTGPFRYAELVLGDFERMTRFDDYWRGTPHLDEIVFRAIASADLYPAQVNTGEIDIAGTGRFSSLDPSQVGQFDSSVAEVVEFVSGSNLNLIFNLNPENPYFQDVRVRQALMLATDRAAILDAVFYGYGFVPLSPYVLPGYYDEDGITATYAFDPDQANALLDEAGWTLGEDGVRENGDVRLEFRISFGSGNTTQETTAAILQEYWRAVGASVVIESKEATALWEGIIGQHDFDAVFDVWSSVPDQRVFFDCLEPDATIFGYCNEDLDVLMDEAAAELDSDARLELNTQILNTLMEDLPLLPIVSVSGLTAVSNRVHNVFPYGVNNYGFNTETWWVDG
jgi:peptide/nickel transport system substrate-binding protein